MKIKSFGHLFLWHSMNPVIRLLIFSDVIFFISRLGFIAPVFAVYITDTIEGGNLEVVGIATTIFLLSKSLLQIPASTVLDRIKGERDDFWAMFIGSFVICLILLLYTVIKTPLELYFVQFLYGLAAAVAFPSWMAIFTRHIDREHEGLEWGMYFTMTDIATAAAASIGGFIAYRYGFNLLFILASIICFIGLAVLYTIKGSLKPAPREQ
jgi:MFS family permease